jgi:hypothetical protein
MGRWPPKIRTMGSEQVGAKTGDAAVLTSKTASALSR